MLVTRDDPFTLERDREKIEARTDLAAMMRRSGYRLAAMPPTERAQARRLARKAGVELIHPSGERRDQPSGRV